MLRSRNTRALLVLLFLCVGSRLLTGVWYIEDPDSLRFALGVLDFDVTRLQPHFPGYPVFIAIVSVFTSISGSSGLGFALVGGLSLFALILAGLRFCTTRIDTPEGLLLATLFFFNPMIWLMSNRYMPDLMGTAILLWILALTVRNDHAPRRDLYIGIALTGILAGVRLSYVPFAAIPFLIAFVRSRRTPASLGLLILGIGIWLVPMIVDAGWDQLVLSAQQQTLGHFTDFGGTVETLPDMEERRIAVVKGIVADGVGGYWQHRSPITLIVTVGLIILIARGAWWMFSRETDGLVIIVLAMCIYIAWILLYQNVVFQTRHILPLIPILLTLAWAGGVALMKNGFAGRFITITLLIAYAATGIVLATQHTLPTAIAQVAEHLKKQNNDKRTILTSSLVNFYMQTHGVPGTYIDAESIPHSFSSRNHDDLIVVGWYSSLVDKRPQRILHFHHNPYVNSIWPEVPLYEYDGTFESGSLK